MSTAITRVGDTPIQLNNRRKDQKSFLIPITVISDGTSAKGLTERLYNRRLDMMDYTARTVISSMKFVPTVGVWGTLVIIKGKSFSDEDRVLPIVRMAAVDVFGLKPLSHENTCLAQDRFSYANNLEAMGLSSVMLMHNPLFDFEMNKWQLWTTCSDQGPKVSALPANDSLRWHSGVNFLFQLKS